MTILTMIGETLKITKKFGVLHSVKRIIYYTLATLDTIKKNKSYKKTKPTKKIIENILGSKMIIDPSDHGIHKELFLDKIREPIATRHIQNILNKEDVVLEIGANIGYYALLESRLCKKIYAIEPVKTNVDTLKENIQLNNYTNIEVFQIAIGEKIGTEKMYISEKANWHNFYKCQDCKTTEEIPMDTINNFLKNKEFPSFVRMDVEGYELKIIRGMSRCLDKIDKMFIELHSDIMKDEETKELINILKKHNFTTNLIIQYDRPGMHRILPNDHIEKIYKGDRGNYEIFFNKQK